MAAKLEIAEAQIQEMRGKLLRSGEKIQDQERSLFAKQAELDDFTRKSNMAARDLQRKQTKLEQIVEA